MIEEADRLRDAEGLNEGIGCMPMEDRRIEVDSMPMEDRSERGFVRLTMEWRLTMEPKGDRLLYADAGTTRVVMEGRSSTETIQDPTSKRQEGPWNVAKEPDESAVPRRV